MNIISNIRDYIDRTSAKGLKIEAGFIEHDAVKLPVLTSTNYTDIYGNSRYYEHRKSEDGLVNQVFVTYLGSRDIKEYIAEAATSGYTYSIRITTKYKSNFYGIVARSSSLVLNILKFIEKLFSKIEFDKYDEK